MKQIIMAVVIVLTSCVLFSCKKSKPLTVEISIPKDEGDTQKLIHVFRIFEKYPKGAKINVVSIENYSLTYHADNSEEWEKSNAEFVVTAAPVILDSIPDANGKKRIANYTAVVQ